MGINLRVSKKAGILKKNLLCSNQARKPHEKILLLKKKVLTCIFLKAAKVEIRREKKKEKKFLGNLMRNKVFLGFGNIKPSLLGATKPKDR